MRSVNDVSPIQSAGPEESGPTTTTAVDNKTKTTSELGLATDLRDALSLSRKPFRSPAQSVINKQKQRQQGKLPRKESSWGKYAAQNSPAKTKMLDAAINSGSTVADFVNPLSARIKSFRTQEGENKKNYRADPPDLLGLDLDKVTEA